MTYHQLNTIKFNPDFSELLKRLRIKEGSSHIPALQEMVNQAKAVASPKALYRLAYIEQIDQDKVYLSNDVSKSSSDRPHSNLENYHFTSRVLRINLQGLQRVFLYIATCGVELEEWSKTFDDILVQYWADAIKSAGLTAARQALQADLDVRYQPGPLSSMNPGSLEDWPISEQVPLFALLGAVQELIGVQLTESMLMLPVKTVSGLFFATQETFTSCQLCPRPDCPNRRAEYQQGLMEKKYQ
jgi:hypothetical protein